MDSFIPLSRALRNQSQREVMTMQCAFIVTCCTSPFSIGLAAWAPLGLGRAPAIFPLESEMLLNKKHILFLRYRSLFTNKVSKERDLLWTSNESLSHLLKSSVSNKKHQNGLLTYISNIHKFDWVRNLFFFALELSKGLLATVAYENSSI